MKRLLIVLTAMTALIPASLWAQDAAKAEFFGGFSVLTSKTGTVRTTPVGWQAAIQGNMTDTFSLVGDFGGLYKNSVDTYTYMGGPRVTHHMANASVFGHALFGGAHSSGGGSAFAMGYGGGIDVKGSNSMAIRLIQFDWVPMRSSGVWTKNNLRFGFGVVFKMQ